LCLYCFNNNLWDFLSDIVRLHDFRRTLVFRPVTRFRPGSRPYKPRKRTGMFVSGFRLFSYTTSPKSARFWGFYLSLATAQGFDHPHHLPSHDGVSAITTPINTDT